MNPRLLLSGAIVISCAALGAACGSTVSTDTASSAGGAGTTSGTSATGAGGSGGQINEDAGDASPIAFGSFDCEGCLCDGQTHFCQLFFGGAAHKSPGPPPEPTCVDDAGIIGCVALPPACLGTPTCACVDMLGCECTNVGAGLMVTCNLP